MRKFILLCLLVFTVSSVVFAQQMTDEQVILYVQEAQSQGKTQQQMLVELMKKGVTKEQIQRIQSKYFCLVFFLYLCIYRRYYG